jgi:hypothetical protein
MRNPLPDLHEITCLVREVTRALHAVSCAVAGATTQLKTLNTNLEAHRLTVEAAVAHLGSPGYTLTMDKLNIVDGEILT